MTLDDAPDVLTVPEAAALARVGRNALYEAVARGDIYGVRIGRTIRIPKVALRRFLGVDVPGVDTAGLIGRDHMPSGLIDLRGSRSTPSAHPAGQADRARRTDTRLASVGLD